MRLFSQTAIILSVFWFVVASQYPWIIQNHQSEHGLFQPIQFTDQNQQDRPSAIRTRFATIDFDYLRNQNVPVNSIPLANKILLNLFDDVVFTSIRQSAEFHNIENFVWIGLIENVSNSQVVIVVHSGIVAINISLDTTFFQVRIVQENIYSISQIDLSSLPKDSDSIIYANSLPTQYNVNSATSELDTSDQPKPGTTIDVMVIYTSATRIIAKGKAQIESEIIIAVTQTNIAYERSGINHRLRLVGMIETDYKETDDIRVDLHRLQNKNDGFMDSAHQLRDVYMADIVTLVTATTNGCGIGFINTHYYPTIGENYAFNVVVSQCLTIIYTFAHELGHNMGLDHDRQNTSGSPVFPYAYGYQEPTGEFSDIMAYSCPKIGKGCPRIQNFSNPDILYNGRPTGVHYLSPNASDNARALNNMGYIAANWRTQDHNAPDGSITSPISGSVSYTPFIIIDASALDNVGGSGIFGVTFWVGENQQRHQICSVIVEPYKCLWFAGDIKNQSIMFSINVIDFAGNTTIAAGGYRKMVVDNKVKIAMKFMPLVKK